MKFHTQSNLDPGNCWQTAVACLLDLEPEDLPDQVVHDQRKEVQPDGSVKWVGPRYMPVLNTYLRVHHGLAYVEVHYPQEIYTALQVREPGLHFMIGRTVRSAENGAKHVVIGKHGELHWDPHPSRAGLTEDVSYAFLVPYPKSWEKMIEDRPCVCRACSG